MKKLTINYLHFILLLTIVLSVGCTKNLEEKPQSIIGPDTYYNTDAEFNSAINGAIHALINGSSWGSFDFNAPNLLCGGAEDITSRSTAPELKQYDEFKTVPNAPAVLAMWGALYVSINLSNAIVSKAATAPLISDANKALYSAQAQYIRALDYFFLTRWFGEVPIITTENSKDAINIVQSKVADIYAYIIADLTFAEANLPATFTEKGRPTKGAATALLAEVYLNMTGWPLKDASKYALAKTKAKEVMDLNLYSLMPNFGDLWLVANKFTNPEFIFFLNGNSSNSATSTHSHQAQRPSEEGGWNDMMTEARFFNAFPAGPRKDFSFWTVFADAPHTTWQNSSIGQPFIAKFRDAGAGGSRSQGTVSSNNGDGFFPISRYSETLLIFAEASNMAEGSPSNAATDAINLVRRRAGGNNQAVYADLPYGMSKAAFNDAVIAEREWELAFECKRWFDLVRTEQVVSANSALYPKVTVNNQLLPKPGTQIDLMKGLTQNPGY